MLRLRRLRFPIGLRLLGGFFLIIGLVGIIAFTATNRLSKLNDTLTELATEEISELRAFFEIRLARLAIESDLRETLSSGDVAPFLLRAKDRVQEIGGLLDGYRGLHPVLSAEEQLLVDILAADSEKILATIAQIEGLIERGEHDEVRRRLVEMSADLSRSDREAVDDLIDHEEAEIDAKVLDVLDNNAASKAAITSLTAALVILSAVLAIGITLSLTRPIRSMVAATDRAGRGDLTSRTNIDRNDELGLLSQRFDAMLSRLERTFAEQRQFYADASHELRTPLTVIRGEAEVARRSPKTTGEYEEALDNIIAVAQQMSGLVEELLFLARSESGQIEYRTEDVALAPLIEETISQCEGMAALKDVRLETRLDPKVSVSGGPAQIRQLVFILLDNAIKYTGSGGRVSVALEDDGTNARIAVSDTGIGIPEEELGHVFERFYRGERARALRRTGSGLGLAIARSIATAHGGDVALESRSGEGTRAVVRLPKLRDAGGRAEKVRDDAGTSRRG